MTEPAIPVLLRACAMQPTDYTPVWFMRQAGRYMPEYRAIRERYSLLDICRQPELAVEVTMQPVHALGVDAAILFADILLPLIPMGIGLHFAAGEGPVIENPVRTDADVAALRDDVAPMESLAYVMTAVRLARHELSNRIPLIGFAGAPFTLASYLIEGGASRNYIRTKMMMYHSPRTWHALMGKLARVVADYLACQVASGAQVVQLFDSWAGALSPDDYAAYVLPHTRSVLRDLRLKVVPTIHFATGTSAFLPQMKAAGGNVIGVDWRAPLDWAWQQLGDDVAIQGNLDPVALMAPRPEIELRVRRILQQAAGRAGHIFNLGHGILPDTPVDNVKAVVDLVHEISTTTGSRAGSATNKEAIQL
ncbi:MAG TPA: uroporphyrinogen decarboxylase [Anaerolineae bacterium]|jgi:uroporphyrinogen decarboxylase